MGHFFSALFLAAKLFFRFLILLRTYTSDSDETMMDFVEQRYHICGMIASAMVTLQITSATYPITHDGKLAFYVCEIHQYLFERMSEKDLDITDLFQETLEMNK
jgi:hypothetical protein